MKTKTDGLFRVGIALIAMAVLIAIFMPRVHAADLTINWTPPTTCTDGSPLLNCPTTGFDVNEATAATGGTVAIKGTVAATVTSLRLNNIAPGNRCYSATTISGALKSAESNRSCVDVPSLPPKAPQGITIKVEVTVSIP